MAMNLRREKFQRRNINRRSSGYLRTEDGQVNWVVGLFLTLFMAVYLFASLRTERFRTASLYMEDALAMSNLASAVVDLEEYGISHKILIENPENAYEVYRSALKSNLNLDESWKGSDNGVIHGTVKIVNYTVYNVDGNKVWVYQFQPGGVSVWEETLGVVKAPNGITIENTSVYSEISFPVEIFRGLEVMARKGKLVDIAGSG